MFNDILKLFKYLTIIVLLLFTNNNLIYANTSLTNEEKYAFQMGVHLGDTSFYIADILSNSKIMGSSVVNAKTLHLQRQSEKQVTLANSLNLSKESLENISKYQKELNEFFMEKSYKPDKLEKAKKIFSIYSDDIQKNINNLYGRKTTWLFDAGFLAGFLNASMGSEYKEKLILLNFGYLAEYIPYSIPTSVIASLSNIALIKNNQLTNNEIEAIKESTDNVINYFTNPDTYTPPVTFKTIVGKWEGRLSDPSGKYSKASILINPDLSATLDVEGKFDGMPVNSIDLTQTLVTFNIKPYGEDRLTIKFSGRIVDDVMSGEAVDVSGRKGMWQFLKVAKAPVFDVSLLDIKNDPDCLDKMVGIWKGKLVEENGAISNLTLNFNLIGDSVLSVENENHNKSLKVASMAVNNEAMKFDVRPDDAEDTNITFLGKIKGRILEGNAKDNAGKRAYWKLIKVEDSAVPQEINFNEYDIDQNLLCDPVITKITDNIIIFVKDEPVIVPAAKIPEAEYKGYLDFGDGTKANVIFILSNNNSQMYLISPEDKSKVALTINKLNITDREITFDTIMEDNEATRVKFKGKIFGDYIHGQAVNAAGQALKWEVVTTKKASTLLTNVKSSDTSKVKGTWSGKVSFSSSVNLPAKMIIDNEQKTLLIDNSEPLNISKVILNGTSVSFVAYNESSKDQYDFSGELEDDTITGRISTMNGMALELSVSLKEAAQPEPLTGIWKGTISFGDADADIVFDFSSDNKKIYVDDSKAESGRVDLIISDMKNTFDTVEFKAKSSKSPSAIKFVGSIDDEDINGTAQNEFDGSKKLSWSVEKSDLISYVPEDNPSLNSTAKSSQDSFSFLDVMTDQDRIVKENTEIVVKDTDINNKEDNVTLKDEDKKPDEIKKDSKAKEEKVEKKNDADKNVSKKEDKEEKVKEKADKKQKEEKKDSKAKEKKVEKKNDADKNASKKEDKEEKVKEKADKKQKEEKKDSKAKDEKVEKKKETDKNASKKVDKEEKVKEKADKKQKEEKKDSKAKDEKVEKKKETDKNASKKVDKEEKVKEKADKKQKEEKKDSKAKEEKVEKKKETDKNASKKEDKEEKVKEKADKKQKEEKKDSKAKEKKVEKKNETDKNASKKEDKEEKVKEKAEKKTDKAENEATDIPKNILGKWEGTLTNPTGDEGKITLVIKPDKSILILDIDGEQSSFDLLDFKLNDAKVSFLFKPEPANDYGITFLGELEKDKLSGDAIDPSGNKGKWSVEKLKN